MRLNRIVLISVVLALLVLTVPFAYAPVCSCPGKVTGGGQIALCEGRGSFGFVVMYFEDDPAPKGELEYIDHATRMNVHGHDMTSLKVWDKRTKANFTGECAINRKKGFTFRVYVEDNGEPGRRDVFIIKLFQGNKQIYEARGRPILHGNIQIHKKP